MRMQYRYVDVVPEEITVSRFGYEMVTAQVTRVEEYKGRGGRKSEFRPCVLYIEFVPPLCCIFITSLHGIVTS